MFTFFHPYVVSSSEGAHTTVGSSKTTNSHVASWADTYPDSGVSLPMDTTESSGSESDSDDSTETVHHSYSYVPSDIEVRVTERFDQLFLLVCVTC